VIDIDESAIGGNASAELPDEGAEATSKQGVDIVMNSRLVEYTLNKKDYMTYIKEYMARLAMQLFYKLTVDCWAPGQSPLHFPTFTLSFSISLFPFWLASPIFLLFNSFPFYQNSPTAFPAGSRRRQLYLALVCVCVWILLYVFFSLAV